MHPLPILIDPGCSIRIGKSIRPPSPILSNELLQSHVWNAEKWYRSLIATFKISFLIGPSRTSRVRGIQIRIKDDLDGVDTVTA